MNRYNMCIMCNNITQCSMHDITMTRINNECSDFSDVSVVEEQEQPEQYEIKSIKKGEKVCN